MPDGTVKRIDRRTGFAGQTWTTEKDALEWLHDQQAAGRKGDYVEPSRERFGSYCREVIDGMRIRPQTRASYLKNLRNHVEPYPIASLPLGQVTGTRLTRHYRQLEVSGRKDHRKGEGLSARTVRYLHTTIHAVLAQAVRDGLNTQELYGWLRSAACSSDQNRANPWRPQDIRNKIRRAAEFTRGEDASLAAEGLAAYREMTEARNGR